MSDDRSWLQGHTKDRTPSEWKRDSLARDATTKASGVTSPRRPALGRLARRIRGFLRGPVAR